MSQNAIVKRNIAPGLVELALMRELECGNGCKNCDICISKPTEEVLVTASDPIGVTEGEWVEAELVGTTAITAALLVYLLPCITLLVGYMAGEWLSFDVMACLAFALGGLILGFLPAWMINQSIQKRDTPEFVVQKRK